MFVKCFFIIKEGKVIRYNSWCIYWGIQRGIPPLIYTWYGDIAQLGEHLYRMQGVRGSNPLISIGLVIGLRLKGSRE